MKTYILRIHLYIMNFTVTTQCHFQNMLVNFKILSIYTVL